MPLTVNFELSDKDLEHFSRAIGKARELAEGKSNQEIVQGAVDLLEAAQKSDPPEFVKQRLLLLDTLIAMSKRGREQLEERLAAERKALAEGKGRNPWQEPHLAPGTAPVPAGAPDQPQPGKA